MFIGTRKFDMEKRSGEPLLVRSRENVFDLGAFLREEESELRVFCEAFHFFVIQSAMTETGSIVLPVSDSVNGTFHFDEGSIVVLSNNYEDNVRGKTEWVADDALFAAFAAQRAELQAFVNGFYPPQIAERISTLLCEDPTREQINQLLGVLTSTLPLPPVLEGILHRVDWHVSRELETCDWSRNPYSSLVFNNTSGFHRGVHTGKGHALRRLTI